MRILIGLILVSIFPIEIPCTELTQIRSNDIAISILFFIMFSLPIDTFCFGTIKIKAHKCSHR